ncbi:hypothetical protein OLMES_0900 [Oleiphilus messinensis]|uniref:PilZ domain-containing protein n=2 Tax=Oleiphilus messinensis TaxID=141451 RepID=A0A1Y0I3E6_9GAMM|nr:hypothetical protein OLMES_0900 [Oleiphilus messinensis]
MQENGAVVMTQDLTDAILSTEHQSDEGRRHPRRAARWRARIQQLSGEYVDAKTINISESGAMLSVGTPVNINAKVKLEISVYYQGIHKTLTTIAIVRHHAIATSNYTIGVEFLQCAEDAKSFLARYANKLI